METTTREQYCAQYSPAETEILILTPDKSSGASGLGGDLWAASQYFLAYVDAAGQLHEGDGRVTWVITEEERKAHGCAWPHGFRRGTVYRLLARELLDKTVPEGRLPSFYNNFLVVKVLEKEVQHAGLQAVQEEYRRPVVIADDALGAFTLNKDYGCFEGSVEWFGWKCSAHLEVSADSKATWTKALKALRALYDSRERMDAQWRAFATEQLTELANDWAEDDVPITQEDFARRIHLSELAVTSGGSYTAYYHDDDMFAGHVVTIDGSLKQGPQRANMEG
ncbi:MAG: DUF2262 domain-containing protein [Oscillospiraceae bacterium]|jgi:hypothetical protein|nr:DUF2262 domain-containing protein [Oscillospiraceae bacterium]